MYLKMAGRPMGEIFFVIKTFVITLVVVLLLQIKIGPQTIDEKIHASIQASQLAAPLEETVKGGVLMLEHGYRKLISLFNHSLKEKINQENAPGNRFNMPEIKRYSKEVSEKVEQETKKTARKFRDRLMDADEEY